MPHKCKFKVNFLVPLGGKSAWKHGEKATGWEGGEPIDCSLVTFQDLVEILKDGSNPPYTAVRDAALRSGIKEDQLRLVLCEKLPCDLNTSNPINLRGGASVKHWRLQHDSARVGASIPEDLIDLLRSEETPTLFLCNLCHSHSGDTLSNTYICKPNKSMCHECQKAATSKEKRGTCEIESNAPLTHRTICSQISFLNYADIFPWVTHTSCFQTAKSGGGTATRQDALRLIGGGASGGTATNQGTAGSGKRKRRTSQSKSNTPHPTFLYYSFFSYFLFFFFFFLISDWAPQHPLLILL